MTKVFIPTIIMPLIIIVSILCISHYIRSTYKYHSLRDPNCPIIYKLAHNAKISIMKGFIIATVTRGPIIGLAAGAVSGIVSPAILYYEHITE